MKHYSLQIKEFTLHILTEETINLPEAKYKGEIHLGKDYSGTIHPPHSSKGEKHIAVYKKQNTLFKLNWGGTAHDKSHRKAIPK
jgi:hypothetical protein